MGPLLHAERRDDLRRRAALDARVRTPGHELRIALDVVDEGEHAARRLCDECRALDLSHGGIVTRSPRPHNRRRYNRRPRKMRHLFRAQPVPWPKPTTPNA